MKRRIKSLGVIAITLASALLLLVAGAQADVFNMGDGLTNLELVPVGNPGNVADTTGYGAVAYAYKIGKYEVTAAQYTEFLNAKAKVDTYGLYNGQMAQIYGCGINQEVDPNTGLFTYSVTAGFENRPVNAVTYPNCVRFANWLHNGQGEGDTEDGAYSISYTGYARNASGKFFAPTEDEWYKAAYYKGGGTNAGYWLYPTQHDIEPYNTAYYYYSGEPTDPTNLEAVAIDVYSEGGPWWTSVVGKYSQTMGAYGTFDQGGNVWEICGNSGDEVYLRGGAWQLGDGTAATRSSVRDYMFTWSAYRHIGFRIAAPIDYSLKIETVPVGDAGNIADASGYGAVDYPYEIGKYEVTAEHYTEFLNAKAKVDTYGLYNPLMAGYYGCGITQSVDSVTGNLRYSVPGVWGRRPVNNVTFPNAARFANWIQNGQGDGDTETGAYDIGVTGYERTANAKWFVPNENEWYKAAYYKGGGTNAGYWLYPTQHDTPPYNQPFYYGTSDPTDPTNLAAIAIDVYSEGYPYWISPVGRYSLSPSAYGTFDQGGNLWEMNGLVGDVVCYRGGSWVPSDGQNALKSSVRNEMWTWNSYNEIGFRLAAAPAPATGILSGTVVLADFGGDASTVAFTVELRGSGTTTYTPALDASGNFAIADVANGTYSVWIKASYWLAKLTDNVVVNGDTNMGSVTLTNGDCDGDNEVTSTDLSILALALGSMTGDPAWDATADLDGDGEVTSTDLSILGINLGNVGD